MNWPSILSISRAAKRLGLEPITLAPIHLSTTTLRRKGVQAIRVDIDNLVALIRECSLLRASYDFAGTASTEEDIYATVGKLCGISICRDQTPHRLNDAATNSLNVSSSRRPAFQYPLFEWQRMRGRLKAILRGSAGR